MIRQLLLLGLICFSFYACKEEFPPEFNDLGCVVSPRPNKNESLKSSIDVKVFIETSGSMIGFMPIKKNNSGTKFQDEMWELVTTLSNNFKQRFSIFQLKEKRTPVVPLSLNGFRDSMNGGKFQLQTSTDIPELLDSVLSYTSSSTVSVFISDLIFSPESGQPASFNQIDTDIKNRFTDKGIASSIFLFESNYVSNKTNSEKSPYYVWVIGQKAGVIKVGELIRREFKGINELPFGLVYQKPDYTILPSTPSVTNAVPLKCESNKRYFVWTDYDNSESNQIEFSVALNLQHLPTFYQDTNYLKKNLVKGNQVEVLSVSAPANLKSKSDEELLRVTGATHIVKLRAKNIVTSDLIVELNLKHQEPKWYESVNADQDDKTRTSTFGLSKLIAGMNKVYTNESFLFDEPIKLLITEKNN